MVIDGVVLEEENMNQRGEKGEKEKRGKEETRVKDKKKRVASFIEVDYKHERRQLHSNQETDHDTIHVHGQE